MIILEEPKRDTFIRVSIIIASVFIVCIAFLIQDKKRSDPEFSPIATVVHLSSSINDPPVIALYRNHNKKHLLILYEVNRKNNNHFEVIQTIELKEKPFNLQNDKESNGVWVLFDDGWKYYNEKLTEENRDYELKADHTASLPFKYDKNTKKVQLFLNEQSIQFFLPENEELVGICFLSKDKKLLLALFENDIKVIVRK